MKNHPDHPGANHLYIHAVEASNDPDRAVPAADRLGHLVPVAGHLVHMPSHIYIRVGRYPDAAQANRDAIVADEDYITQCRAQGMYPIGYYPHNIHFLWAALAMEGRSQESMEAARKVASKHTDEHLHQPGFGFGHLLRTIPLFSMVRFGQWDQIMAEPAPTGDSAFATGIWHWSRGLAFANQGKAKEANTELEEVKKAAADPSVAKLDIFGGNTLDKLLAVADEFLAGEIAARQKKFPAAITHFQKAVELEDALRYREPPDWPIPAREWLGATLLAAGRPAEAEKVYRQNLDRHRDNGWGLSGLAKSLDAQGKKQEAADARQRFEKAWANADFKL
jgi:tetratricopeptide (TPR) repeat protein